ncbi:SH3 domain-containing protein [Kurthia senegalensis]|uniref:SH3 domain-containing protein n=1 Tax=Kurthia senegalensis TaxID=1033740 RepID=UPI0002894D85|nr:SH3 domain-containing protein [Kurthia senegalensis]
MRKTASPSGVKSGITVPYGAKLTVKKVAANGWLYVTYNKKQVGLAEMMHMASNQLLHIIIQQKQRQKFNTSLLMN